MVKKIVIGLSLCMIVLTLASCNNENVSEDSSVADVSKNMAETENSTDEQFDVSSQGEYVNLDFSNAVYDILDMEEFVDLTYYMTYTGEEYETEEEKILANMERMAGSADSSYLKYWKRYGEEYEQPEDGSYLAPLAVSAADIATEDKPLYQYHLYNDGEYSAILYSGSNMLEMGDSKLWADLAGSEMFNIDYQPVYRPMFVEDAVLVEEYFLPDDDIEGISYTLMDGEAFLEDAVEYIEGEMKNYYFVKSDYLEFQVYEIDVYQLATGEYYYYCYMQGYIDGIPVSYDQGHIVTEDDKDAELGLIGIRDHVAMIYSDTISYFWSQCGYEDAEVETVNTEDMITLDEACEIVSENLTDESVFNVTTVSMEYYVGDHDSYDNPTNGEYSLTDYRKIRLYYTFKINNPRVLGYSSVTFLVDAVTGEFITYVS